MHSHAASVLPKRGASLRNNGLMRYASMYAEMIAPTKGSTMDAEM
jgi:hypothetical protein